MGGLVYNEAVSVRSRNLLTRHEVSTGSGSDRVSPQAYSSKSVSLHIEVVNPVATAPGTDLTIKSSHYPLGRSRSTEPSLTVGLLTTYL